MRQSFADIFNDIFLTDSEIDFTADMNVLEDINQQQMLEKVKEQLVSSKLFLNMVIHDMRNPSVSTKTGIQHVIHNLDQIKSLTHGYGSFEYEPGEFERSDIVKVVVHIMGDSVDALTFLFHNKKAFEYSKAICRKIKETIPPHLFTVSIQARVGTKTIAK